MSLIGNMTKFFGAAALCAMIGACGSGEDAQTGTANTPSGGSLVVTAYGGTYQDALDKAFFTPFAEQNNVTLREETYTGNLAQIKSMVETNNVTWDVVDIEADLLFAGVREDLFEPIDLSRFDKDDFLPGTVFEYGIANQFWSTVMAYNTEEFNEDNPPPQNWAEFWDVENFPGPRSLRNWPVGNLEFALLADGVPVDELYPLDIERAFASLDKIKPHIELWWEAGEQPASALAQGEVVLTSAYNGRIYNREQNGDPVDINWNQGSLNIDLWVIPRGSENKSTAMDFIEFAMKAEHQAVFSSTISYGSTNKEAVDMVDEDMKPHLPTSPQNYEKQFKIDIEWWADNLDEMVERWQGWVAG